ncbi:MAG TPA: hypothetical protein V6C96_01845, partial [Vampirovibrionales bacterium]
FGPESMPKSSKEGARKLLAFSFTVKVTWMRCPTSIVLLLTFAVKLTALANAKELCTKTNNMANNFFKFYD